MISRNTRGGDLHRRLDEVHRRIAEHPIASEDLLAANRLVEDKKAEKAETDEINTALEGQGLPRLEELGKHTAKGLLSWELLHRQKRKIERKISPTE